MEPAPERAEFLRHARAVLATLPADVALSHVSAARLLSWPLPRALQSDPLVDVSRANQLPQIRRHGVAGHRGLESRRVIVVRGLRVTSPADTWCDLGATLDRGLSWDDVVIAGDAAVNAIRGRLPPGTGIAELSATLSRRIRARGARLLRSALGDIREGSASGMETLTRLMFLRHGFPEPELNADVYDTDGGWILNGDLVWRDARVIGEYQGAHHRTLRQRGIDATRRELARENGWRVIEIFEADVRNLSRRHTCLRRFAEALSVTPVVPARWPRAGNDDNSGEGRRRECNLRARKGRNGPEIALST